MSERDGFQHGVPCWVDTWQDDIDGIVGFYTGLFDWEAQVGERYTMFTHRGLDAAGAGAPRPEGVPPAWTSYVWVDDVDAVAARATSAGGTLVREPFDSLDGGRMAIVADPAGAVLGVWQPGEHRGAQVVNEPGAWSMSLLSTPDPEGATAFYAAVFGWETQAFGDVATMWRLPGFVGGEPQQPVPRDVVAVMVGGEQAAWGVDFWVEEVDAAAERATALGGAVLSPPADSPVGRNAVLADPTGAVLSVSRPAALGPPRT
jgi:predicted enzyme related to lactoylglutathione lyase